MSELLLNCILIVVMLLKDVKDTKIIRHRASPVYGNVVLWIRSAVVYDSYSTRTMVRVEYGVVRVDYEKNHTRRHPRDNSSTSVSTSYSTRPSRVEYEGLTRVDEFCRVDGAKFDFVHKSCPAEYGKCYIRIIP